MKIGLRLSLLLVALLATIAAVVHYQRITHLKSPLVPAQIERRRLHALARKLPDVSRDRVSELTVLVEEGRVEKAEVFDQWGRLVRVRRQAREGILWEFTSAGPDGKFDSDDDITVERWDDPIIDAVPVFRDR